MNKDQTVETEIKVGQEPTERPDAEKGRKSASQMDRRGRRERTICPSIMRRELPLQRKNINDQDEMISVFVKREQECSEARWHSVYDALV